MSPEVWQPVAGILAIVFGIGLCATGTMAVRTWLNRVDRAPARRNELEEDRLRHLEQAVDAIAVEVERISEGQRFTTKLLADRPAAPPSAPAEEKGSTAGPREPRG